MFLVFLFKTLITRDSDNSKWFKFHLAIWVTGLQLYINNNDNCKKMMVSYGHEITICDTRMRALVKICINCNKTQFMCVHSSSFLFQCLLRRYCENPIFAICTVWQGTDARNVGCRKSLRWPIHLISSIDKNKLSFNTPPTQHHSFLKKSTSFNKKITLSVI